MYGRLDGHGATEREMSARHGIVAYACYVPAYRLTGEELWRALGSGSPKGWRPVASFDEDSVTMGVEAARHLAGGADRPSAIHFATTTPAYADKTNATAIHAALDLGRDGLAVDHVGSARSATAALRAAEVDGGVAVLADLRTGRPGSADERSGADAGAAIRFGPAGESVAEVIASASTTAEFLDRWRTPGAIASEVWEERFGQEMYEPLIDRAVARALERAGVSTPDHVVVSSPHARVARAARRKHGGDATNGLPEVGYAGAADGVIALMSVLDVASPGQTILFVNAVDGCDALVLRARAEAGAGRRGLPLAAQIDRMREINYTTYLTWRGLIERELPRRPEPDRPASPPSARAEQWKFGFVGSVCSACSRVHLPPKRVCSNCGAIDRMEQRRLADVLGTIATYTVDRLAYSPFPPMIDAVVDFDNGGRYPLEVADADPNQIAIGTRVEMTFRRLYTTGGVHNYFWKARPADASAADGKRGGD